MALVEAKCRIARLWDREARVGSGNRIVIPRWFARNGARLLIYAAEIDGEPVLVIKKLTEAETDDAHIH